MASTWQDTGTTTPQAETTAPRPSGRRRPTAAGVTLAAALTLSAAATIGAMRHTSTTFDEILLPAAGARGYVTGRFDLVLDHPPLMQYLYGLPVFLSRPHYPSEAKGWSYDTRYAYAQLFYFMSGNDPERIAFMARLVAAGIAVLLGLSTYLYARRRFGEAEAVVAAGLVAFLPDVLAHGGVSYNDLPLALAFLLGAWSLDRSARRPGVGSALAAGAVCAVAVGVKFSAVALAPLALVLVALEVAARPRGGRLRYLGAVAWSAPLALLAAYVALVLIYRGDPTLAQFRVLAHSNLVHVEEGHDTPAYLLGRFSLHGFREFFPVAFLYKTPVALHLLLPLAALGLWRSLTARAGEPRWCVACGSQLRMPAAALLVFGGFLLASKLDIGFRHAMPILPMICLLTAVGVVRLWRRVGRLPRVGIAALLAAYVLLPLSFYPDFLAFTSLYTPSRDLGYQVLDDSSLDWGQGLLCLRDYMHAHGIQRIYLSYFGSALPEGYGIHYAPLPSFFALLGKKKPAERIGYAAISATNLVGNYLKDDPFARFRDVRPDTVLGHVMFIYRLRE
jgi:4-amino-4-deoxy-L-arabinose transferase-like glycosyltransferase